MKVYLAQYSDCDSDTFEDVLVAVMDNLKEDELYREHGKIHSQVEWLNRRLEDDGLTDDDIFYYFMSDEGIYGHNQELENLLEDGDMIIIGKEY